MERSLAHPVLIAALLATTLALAVVPSVHAADPQLPRQMLLLPLPIAPGPDEPALPVRLAAHVIVLPDDRDAQLWRLSWWVGVGEAHRVRVALDYVGVEGSEHFRWGGGASRLQWSTRMGALWGRTLAFDLEGVLPHGDESLHPLSAKAPSAQLRLRAQALEAGAWQVWAGWWARRVSPPDVDVRVEPDGWFRSGSGFDVVLRRAVARADAEVVLQRPLAGLPSATWLHSRVDLPLSDDLAVSVGGMIALASAQDRPIDHGWSLGLTWRPAPREREESTPDGDVRRGADF